MARNGTTYAVGDLTSMTGAHDNYRAQMGTSAYESAGVTRSADPGGSNAARTEYPTQGHRAAPPHAQAAIRRQREIDGITGSQMYAEADDVLQNEMRHVQSMSTAANQAILRSPSHQGRLGPGVVLANSAEHLPHLLGTV